MYPEAGWSDWSCELSHMMLYMLLDRCLSAVLIQVGDYADLGQAAGSNPQENVFCHNHEAHHLRQSIMSREGRSQTKVFCFFVAGSSLSGEPLLSLLQFESSSASSSESSWSSFKL